MSLQDQLLKAGLVDDKKAHKIKKNKQKQTRQKQKNKLETTDEAKLAAQQGQLVEMNRQPREAGDIDYSFTDSTLIKRMHVTAPQAKQLGEGRLCIIKMDGQYELIPTLVAEKIQQRDESAIILSNPSTEEPDEDDPYADYKVPDDLMW